MNGRIEPRFGRHLTTLLAVIALTIAVPSRPQAAGPAALTGTAATPSNAKKQTIREPAVAGLFYPAGREELERMVDRLLAAAPQVKIENLRALVCPHAGYPYSGPTAAHAYRLLERKQFATVMILAASHYALFDGIAVTTADAYRTPLGDLAIAEMATQLARQKPFGPEPRCPVQRPAWFRQSSRTPPATGEDTPETWEHSVEVQLPFLQRTLKDFKLVPVIFGQANPAQAARVLASRLDDRLLLIASSDLSHYHPYSQAKELDQSCVKDICDLNLAALEDREACGKMPILTVMHLARLKGWKTRLLDYRNSGDTAGDKSGVVGYAAIAFYDEPKTTEAWTPAEKQRLLVWARQCLQTGVTSGQKPSASATNWPAKFQTPKGCFVTLTKKEQLRGCIGHIFPQEPLIDAIADNARSAALRDPRFPPVTPAELQDINVEVSILTTPQPLAFTNAADLLAKLRPQVDGVVLKIGLRGATYLPQVWEQIPDPVQFLNHLAEKAGCESSAWRQSGTEILTYQVEAFKETQAARPPTDP